MELHPAVAERLARLAPDQRAAATAPPGPVLCVAPAGSGKTTTLVGREPGEPFEHAGVELHDEDPRRPGFAVAYLARWKSRCVHAPSCMVARRTTQGPAFINRGPGSDARTGRRYRVHSRVVG